SLLLCVPLFLGVALLALGVASFLSAVNARFRDIQHALPLAMTVFLYISPVLYPLSSVPESIRWLVVANPLTGLVDGFRASVTGAEPYSWPFVWVSLAVAALVFVLG